jgi:hypothetical protein
MSPRPQHPRLDLWMSVAAAVVVGAVVLATVVMWVSAPTGPATFELEVRPVGEQVDVEVSNSGGSVATEVVVRATFPDGSEVDQTVAWLSPGESSSVVFQAPDGSADVDVQVVSFTPND